MLNAAENINHKSKEALKLMSLVKYNIDYNVIEFDDDFYFWPMNSISMKSK